MRAHGLLIVIGFTTLTSATLGDSLDDRTGWAAMVTGGAHQVAFSATLLASNQVQVEHFTYDGTAPLVYFYLGGNDSDLAFEQGLQLQPLLNRAYNDESLLLDLPLGASVDDYNAISVWCAQFDVNFGSDVFRLRDAADIDGDGDIDAGDYAAFADCARGPNQAPAGDIGVGPCQTAFDRDADGDVDQRDYQIIQQRFTGPPPADASYELIFDAIWSAATHPVDFPGSPHFSSLIGGTHNDAASFWAEGVLASPGIEAMAEIGGSAMLRAEVNAAISAGNAGEWIAGPGIGLSPGTASVSFNLTQAQPQATVVCMIAPSPDWFVGISGYPLFSDNQWTPQIVIPLLPYDAGTDSATTYVHSNQDTNPQEPIIPIFGYPFENGSTQLPLGTFTLQRID